MMSEEATWYDVNFLFRFLLRNCEVRREAGCDGGVMDALAKEYGWTELDLEAVEEYGEPVG